MTQVSDKRQPRRGRIFPEYSIPPEEIARQKAEDLAFYKRCRAIFDAVQPGLLPNHYNWFIAIEPDSGDYFIDTDEKEADRKARHQRCHSRCFPD